MKGSRDRWILYPAYFDAARTRGRGRRVPRALAVERPTAETLAAAAKALGLAAEVEPEAGYPRAPWAGGGRVKVEKRGPKDRLLVEMARRLRGPRD